MGRTTEYRYAHTGDDPIRIIDARSGTTRMEYDALGQLTRRVRPLGQQEQFSYDATGNMVSRMDFNGDAITLEYDSNGRLTSKGFADSTSVTFTYTPTGQRETVK